MSATANEEAGPPSSNDARKGETMPSKTQLGDFSRIFDFLSITSPAACHNRNSLSSDDRLNRLSLGGMKDTPGPVLDVTGYHRKTRSTTSKAGVVISELGPDYALTATVMKSTSTREGHRRAATSSPPESHVNGDLASSDISLQKLKTLKAQILSDKLLREMSLDEKLQLKHSDEKRITHVFIDMSNIYIGFNDTYKTGMGFPDHTRVPRAPLDFEVLSNILERGRSIGAREVVGSAADPENVSDLPRYFHDAKNLSYETSILRRVLKPAKASQGASSPLSGSAGGISSSSESGEYYGLSHREMSYREQGVDEILQLKMGNTAMAYLGKPGIMVLATGDAEKAEYSDGFQKQVERILKMGWIVEVVSWKRGLSYAWRRSKWAQKWGDQFRIILLDPFVDDLLAT